MIPSPLMDHVEIPCTLKIFIFHVVSSCHLNSFVDKRTKTLFSSRLSIHVEKILMSSRKKTDTFTWSYSLASSPFRIKDGYTRTDFF